MDEWIDGRMGEWLIGRNNTIKWAGQIYVYIERERERERERGGGGGGGGRFVNI